MRTPCVYSFGLLCLALAPAVAQQNAIQVGSVRLRADRLVYDQQDGVVHAEGHVLVEGADAWLTADAATYDEARAVAVAQGCVSIRAPRRQLRGASCVYEFDEKRGEVEDPDGWDESAGIRLFLTGSKLAFAEGTWTLHDARVRSSGKDHPSYELTAKEISYVGGHSWHGKQVKIRAFGMQVLSLDDYDQEVTDPVLQSLQWIPLPGLNEQDGLFAQWTVERNVFGDLRLRAIALAGTTRGVSVGARLAKGVGDRAEVWVRGGYREAVGGLIRPYLRWNSAEVGAASRLTAPTDSWRAVASATYGWYHERPSNAQTTRVGLGLTARTRSYAAGDSTTFYFQGGAQGYEYATGQNYGYAWAGGFWDHRFARDWRLWGGLIDNAVVGRSPLEADTVAIPWELRLGSRVDLPGRFAAEGEVRYDLNRGAVRYTTLGLRYRSADFTYRLRYNVETRFLLLDLLLPDS